MIVGEISLKKNTRVCDCCFNDRNSVSTTNSLYDHY